MPRIKLEQFENTGNGRTAVLSTEALWPNTVEKIGIRLTPNGAGVIAKNHITRLKLIFGTKVVWELAGSQIQTMNDFAGHASTADVLFLHFVNLRARTVEQQYIAAPDLGALGVRKVQIQLDLAGATDPFKIEAWGDVVRPGLLTPAGNRVFRQIMRTPLSPSTAVQEQPQQLNYGQAKGALLCKLHFFSNLVTKLRIKRDGSEFYEDIDAALQNAYLKDAGWVPQANVFSYAADEDDNVTKSLTSIRNDGQGGSLIPQQILLSTSAGGAFDAIADTIAGLDG